MKNPKVSIVIPTYNRKQYLERALNSVFNQTYLDYEIIVVDDASSDETVKFITENHPTLRLVALTKNRGAGGARNEGMSIAKGQFIAFLDSDDEWEPSYLETQVSYIEGDSSIVLTFCSCLHKTKEGKIEKFSCKPWLPYPDLTYHLLSENFILTASIVVVRTEALEKSGYFNESLKICQDKELFLRLFCLGQVVHVPHYLVTKYSHSTNLTGDYKLWIKETFDLLDIFFSHDLSEPYKHFETETRSHNALRLARIFLREKKQLLFAIQMLFKSFLTSPKYISQQAFKKLIQSHKYANLFPKIILRNRKIL